MNVICKWCFASTLLLFVAGCGGGASEPVPAPDIGVPTSDAPPEGESEPVLDEAGP